MWIWKDVGRCEELQERRMNDCICSCSSRHCSTYSWVGAGAPSSAPASANRMRLICFWTGNQSRTMLRYPPDTSYRHPWVAVAEFYLKNFPKTHLKIISTNCKSAFNVYMKNFIWMEINNRRRGSRLGCSGPSFSTLAPTYQLHMTSSEPTWPMHTYIHTYIYTHIYI